ncbi:MAG: hypothetical protein GYA17_21535 [Chloroflexi bacterium]|nr:hypothetical protein [Chloroflexota bacterium]
MINQDKIDEWIREAEERPASATILIRYIANRLKSLAERNEELLAENVQLYTGARVADYEAQIAQLQYQLELLKRQVSGDPAGPAAAPPPPERLNVILYTAHGAVLRLELDPTSLQHGQVVAQVASLDAGGPELGLLAAGSQEELLLLFDTGRTVTCPVASIPPAGAAPDWSQAYWEEPRGAENLAVVAPIGRMALAESCVQVSRKGWVKRMLRSGLETYLTKNYIGTGVKLPKDRSCALLLGDKDDRLVLASRQGFLLGVELQRFSYTSEETLRLGRSDYVAASFIAGDKPLLALLTHNGKVLSREAGWLKPLSAETPKGRGQAVISEERRRAGVHLVGAAAVDPADWGVILDRAGRLTVYSMQALLDAGAVPGPQELLGLAVFAAPAGGAA